MPKTGLSVLMALAKNKAHQSKSVEGKRQIGQLEKRMVKMQDEEFMMVTEINVTLRDMF